jgi:hypothetical protein
MRRVGLLEGPILHLRSLRSAELIADTRLYIRRRGPFDRLERVGATLGKTNLKKPRTQKSRGNVEPVTFDTVRQFALALPGVEEATSYGTTAFKVGGKLLARFHQDGESLAIKVEYAAREVLMGVNPKTFYITDHYRCWPWMLVRISNVDRDDLRQLLEEAWRNTAPKRLLAGWEGRADP